MQMRNLLSLLLIIGSTAHAANTKYIVSQAIQSNGTYVTGMVIGGASTIQLAKPGSVIQGVQLVDVTVSDSSGQSVAMDLFFFNGPTGPAINRSNVNGALSPDKRAFAPEEASIAQSCVGVVSIVAGDYAGVGLGGGIATKQVTNLSLQPDNSTGSFYVVPVIRGTATYVGSTAPAALTLKFGAQVWDY